MGKRKRMAMKAAEEVQPQAEDVVSDEEGSEKEEELPEGTRFSDDKPKRGKWINKERVLVLGTRGITHRDRHLMVNLHDMMPQSKKEPKMNPKDPLIAINEICEIRNCSKVVFFENKKRKDLYMWLANASRGPSVKFLVENVHTMEELRMTGNCLKGSRPLLSFDPSFAALPQYQLMKELLTQIFSTPNHHPKSQPFIDNVLTFTILDHRIWMRNYQIVEEDGSLAEIGPRLTLNPIKVFEGSFTGACLWSNPEYVSPNKHRRSVMEDAKAKYTDRVAGKHGREMRQPKGTAYTDNDKFGDVFQTIAPEVAQGMAKDVFKRKRE